MRCGYITPVFSGAKNGGNGYKTLALSEVPRKGKIRNGYKTVPSQGAKIGWNDCATPTLARVPQKADKIRSGYITPTLLGGQNWAEWLDNP